MIAVVFARSRNNVIGKDNAIPWRLRADLLRFKDLTLNKTVILGRKSYESMVGYYDRSGRPMPAKTYIVVTRNQNYAPARQNAATASSIEQAVDMAKKRHEDILFAGGAQIYQQSLLFADRVYVTEVDINIEGDAYGPELVPTEWAEIAREKHTSDHDNEYNYDYVTFERVKH